MKKVGSRTHSVAVLGTMGPGAESFVGHLFENFC